MNIRTILLSSVFLFISAAVFGGYWAYANFDETAEDGWSRTLRERLYTFIDAREERIVLAPDDRSKAPQFVDEHNLTFDWFTKKSPAWDVALDEFKGKPGVRYLEVGAYEGRSVMWMFSEVLTHPRSSATVIDIFYDMGVKGYSQDLRDRYDANIARVGATERTETIVGFSQVQLRKLPVDSFDIIYIDGSHFAPSVLEDAVLAQRLLKEGGIIIFDDYRWFIGAPRMRRPKLAIDTFLEFFEPRFEVLHNTQQVIARKISSDAPSRGVLFHGK